MTLWSLKLCFEFQVGRFGDLVINFLLTVTMDLAAFKRRIPCYDYFIELNKIKSQSSGHSVRSSHGFQHLRLSIHIVRPSSSKNHSHAHKKYHQDD